MQLRRFFLLVGCLLCMAANEFKIRQLLVIGDSISIGYTPYLEKALVPAVVVVHNPGNGGSTVRGVENLDQWLDNKDWDLILFNFGLHDLVYKDQDNKYDVTNGKQAVSQEEYRKNLGIIVSRLKKTNAKLFFVTTTVVPENSPGRKVEDPARYNDVAKELMKTAGIPVIDLYKASQAIHPAQSKPGNVHYTPEGYEQLAAFMLDAIRPVLKN